MKRAIFSGPGRIDIEEIALPVADGNRALVKVEAVAVCTLEQRFFKGVRQDYPFWGGHEIGGRVMTRTSGSGVESGEIVAVSRFPRCGECDLCQTGRDNLCGYFTPAGPTGQAWGPAGLSEYLACSPEDLFPLPPGSDAVTAALLEPLACVWRSLDRSGCVAGDSLAVFGLGFMGALHVRAAQARGIRAVGIVAQKLGCAPETVLCAPDFLLADAPADSLDLQVDAAICVRGGAEAVRQAISLVRRGGRIVLFESIYANQGLDLDLGWIRHRELSLVGTVNHTRQDFQSAAALLHQQPSLLTGLVATTFAFDEVGDAVATAVRGNAGRVVITM